MSPIRRHFQRDDLTFVLDLQVATVAWRKWQRRRWWWCGLGQRGSREQKTFGTMASPAQAEYPERPSARTQAIQRWENQVAEGWHLVAPETTGIRKNKETVASSFACACFGCCSKVLVGSGLWVGCKAGDKEAVAWNSAANGEGIADTAGTGTEGAAMARGGTCQGYQSIWRLHGN